MISPRVSDAAAGFLEYIRIIASPGEVYKLFFDT